MNNTNLPPRPPQNGCLSGIKILDLTRLLPGPLATMLLADWGADVIKIEDPAAPDEVRFYPPYTESGQSAYFLALNRSKRSLALDLRQAADKQRFLDLCQTADIVIESFRPGVMARLGIDYATVKTLNERIIFVSISGYGTHSPYSAEAGHDLNYIARAGLLDLCGNADAAPAIPNFQVADIAAGSYMASNACLLALCQRHQTGKGDHVQVSMLDALMPLLCLPLVQYRATQEVPQRGQGVLSGSQPNYNVYRCSDGKYVALAALEPKFWNNFCQLVGRSEWQSRIIPNMPETQSLVAEVADLFAQHSQATWLQLAQQSDICLSPINNIAEATHDAHFAQKGGVWQIHQHPQYGEAVGIKNPLQFENSPTNEGWAAPLLNEDKDYMP
jgi:alpha-methylacyl-CoA racemase